MRIKEGRMGWKKLLLFLFLKIGFLPNAMNAATMKSPLENTSRDLITETKYVNALIPSVRIRDEHFVIPLLLEPVLTPESDVTFHLFTRTNPDEEYLLRIGDLINLMSSPLDSEKITKIIIHGWTDSGNANWLKKMRKNYLLVGDYNVVIVDWYPTSAREYSIAAKLTQQIGQYVGELLEFLRLHRNISLTDVHIIGHSLGAHIAGFVGSNLSGEIGRITGLDPARPGFEAPIYKDRKSRLDFTDAIFVDVIHSCAGTLGFIRAIGDVDFYPNGGTFPQPGCSSFISQSCSHERSYVFMAESILYHEAFIGRKCDSWTDYKNGKCSENLTALMGEGVDTLCRGLFFLDTNGEAPYGRGYLKISGF